MIFGLSAGHMGVSVHARVARRIRDNGLRQNGQSGCLAVAQGSG